jgi:hypothetical protein
MAKTILILTAEFGLTVTIVFLVLFLIRQYG